MLNFHTVSAAIRAEAWRRTPFRSVRTLGEDLLWAREVMEAGWALVHEPASCVHHSHDYSLHELFARNVDDGIANRDITGRAVDARQILPQIMAMARGDWTYLREAAGLSADELEQWQLESVLRRTAQTVGQWLGTNHKELPVGTAAAVLEHAEGAIGAVPAREAVLSRADPPRHSPLSAVRPQRGGAGLRADCDGAGRRRARGHGPDTPRVGRAAAADRCSASVQDGVNVLTIAGGGPHPRTLPA